jgi:hypothetical protein
LRKFRQRKGAHPFQPQGVSQFDHSVANTLPFSQIETLGASAAFETGPESDILVNQSDEVYCSSFFSSVHRGFGSFRRFLFSDQNKGWR